LWQVNREFKRMNRYSKLSDSELIELLKQGDEHAFTEIYDRYKAPLFVHAFNLVRDEDQAKDILQQVFLNLWTGKEQIENRPQFAGYLYTSVRNRFLTQVAHQTVESKYLNSLADFAKHGECSTDHRLRETQLWEIIDKELATLPERMRLVFELSRKRQMSHKEIAQELGITEKTVKNQINGTLKVLRAKLGIFVYLLLLSDLF
jgi:RNA polymerase sigma-70 factor (family 1)